MIDTKPIKTVAVYGRVSTARQEEEETVKTQLSAVREFAKKNGYKIVQEYADEGWSGDMLKRPALDQLRIDAKRGLWDAVLIYDPDRLARRYFYQELVIDELRDLGIETLFVTMPPVVNDEDRLMFGVRGVFAQYERMKIAERFRIGKVRKAKDGNIVASEAPYGYNLVVRSGKRGDTEFCETHYAINEVEARVVQMIFEWIADDGLTLRKVVKRLNELSIKPRWSTRGVWNTSTLSSLVRNRSYIGEGHYGASYAVVPVKPLKTDAYRRIKKTSRKIRPENEWIKIAVPAILKGDAGISLFARAQEQMKANFVLARRNRKNSYLLSGKIRCVCGCTRTGEGPQHGKHLYYRCSNRVMSHPLPRTCNEKGINARISDNLLWSRLHGLITSKEQISGFAREWVENRGKQPQRTAADIQTMRKDVAKLKEQECRYVRAFGEGALTLEKFREYNTPVIEKIAALESRIAVVETAPQPPREIGLPDEKGIEKFVAEAAAQKDLSFEQKQAIVHRFVDKIEGTPSHLQVHGRITIPNHVEFFTSDRNCGSA